MKKVSVIVPCYNVAGYLDKCIRQILSQSMGTEYIDLILVDDASTDGDETKKLIQRYEQCYPEIITAVFLEENMKQGGARNVGVSYAGGEYITFCDADDWLLEETLEHTYDAAKEYDADMVSFERKYVNRRDDFISLEKGDGNRLYELDIPQARKEFLVNMKEDLSSQNKLFRLSFIRENQIAFAEHFFMEEASFTIPVRLYAKRSLYLDEKLYICYLSPESTMRNQDWESRKWDNLQVWLMLMEELSIRGILEGYRQELEYLFFSQGIGWGVAYIFQKGGILTKKEWEFLTDIIRKMIPDIRENPYVKCEDTPLDKARNDLLFAALDMDFSVADEMTKERTK